MRCISCTMDVPDGMFCTRCGRKQIEGSSRYAHYSAHPGEHVFHPGVLTTLFPHLGHEKLHQFRWAMLTGVACVLLLDVAGLITAALLAAAFLVPILYLIYLYEAQVYKDEPAPVLGFTLGGGAVLGIVVTIIVKATTGDIAFRTFFSDDTSTVLWLGLLVPLVQEVLKPIPALAIRLRGGFPERVDGLVFGVAAGLGFSVSECVVRFSAVLSSLPEHSEPANWVYTLVTVSVLLPLLHGSATGAIVCALWRIGEVSFRLRGLAVIGLALAAHVAFITGSQLLNDRSFSQLLILSWQALIVGALLIVIRYMLHEALLEESVDMGFTEMQCHNCHHHVFANRFCPHCGKALAAMPGRPAATSAGTAPVVGLEV